MRQIQKRTEPWHFTKWKNDFRNANGREPLYTDLYGTNEYWKLKKSLVEEQGYICCYCEKRIGQDSGLTDCDIEHFMPRNPDRRLLGATECDICKRAQLDYGNILASCKGNTIDSLDHCNHKKDNWFDFGKCVSPVTPEIENLFGYHISGKMLALHDNPMGIAMLQHLNLNTYVLCEQRKMAYIAVLEMEFEETELEEDTEYIYSREQRAK